MNNAVKNATNKIEVLLARPCSAGGLHLQLKLGS